MLQWSWQLHRGCVMLRQSRGTAVVAAVTSRSCNIAVADGMVVVAVVVLCCVTVAGGGCVVVVVATRWVAWASEMRMARWVARAAVTGMAKWHVWL
jgi:hypothetical protein